MRGGAKASVGGDAVNGLPLRVGKESRDLLPFFQRVTDTEISSRYGYPTALRQAYRKALSADHIGDVGPFRDLLSLLPAAMTDQHPAVPQQDSSVVPPTGQDTGMGYRAKALLHGSFSRKEQGSVLQNGGGVGLIAKKGKNPVKGGNTLLSIAIRADKNSPSPTVESGCKLPAAADQPLTGENAALELLELGAVAWMEHGSTSVEWDGGEMRNA